MAINRRVLLTARPDGVAQASHFSLDEAPVERPGEGEILVRNSVLSVEPAMRGWTTAGPNYSEPVAIGAVMRALASGHVVESRHRTMRRATPSPAGSAGRSWRGCRPPRWCAR